MRKISICITIVLTIQFSLNAQEPFKMNRSDSFVTELAIPQLECAAPSSCNLVKNGGFEFSLRCGPWYWELAPQSILPEINCWGVYRETPDLFKRNCTTLINGYPYNLGVNTWGSIPVFEVHDAPNLNNNTILGLGASSLAGDCSNCEGVQTMLAEGLKPNKQYVLTYWAMAFDDYLKPTQANQNYISGVYGGTTGTALFYTCETQPTPLIGAIGIPFAANNNFTLISDKTIPKDNKWHKVTQFFTFSGSKEERFLILGVGLRNQRISYMLFDDIEIKEAENYFEIPTPASFCLNSGKVNLNNFVTVNNTSYMFSFTGNNVSFNGSYYEFNPIQAGENSIEFSYTDENGCTVSIPQTIIVQTSTQVNATVLPAIACIGDPILLTGYNADNYTWSPSFGLNTTTGQQVTATPNQQTLYTLTGSNSCGSATANALVKYEDCKIKCLDCKNFIDGQIGDVDFRDDAFCITSNLNISGVVNFINSEFSMNKDVKIIVQENATLNIEGSHLYSCQEMWRGIVVLPGGKLNINGFNDKSTLIEDAYVAVDMAYYSVEFPDYYSENQLTINNTIFNRNNTGVFISLYPLDYGDEKLPFSVINTVFTSRQISFTPNSNTWPNVTDLIQSAASQQTNNNNVPPVLTSPFIENVNFNPLSTFAFLKSPLNNQKPVCGIRLYEVGSQNVNSTVEDGGAVVIGTKDYINENRNAVIFDNLYAGIIAEKSNLSVYNNVFQNPYSLVPKISYGIYFNSGENEQKLNVSNPSGGEVCDNAFFDMDYGIYSNLASNITINRTHFRAIKNTNTLSQHPKTAVYAVTKNINNVAIQSNKIYNVSSGVRLLHFANDFNNTGLINVSNNTMGSFPSELIGKQPKDAHIKNAITVVNAIPAPIINNNTDNVTIGYNIISSTHNGIKISNWLGKNCKLFKNYITLIDNPNKYINQNITQYGILAEGCTGETILGTQLNNNIINTIQPNMVRTSAIEAEMLTNATVECNSVSNAQHGIQFTGTNVPTKFWDNVFANTNTNGFTLNNAGMVGIRPDGVDPSAPAENGYYKCPSNNQWLGTWGNSTTAPFKTNAINNSDATQSVLWVNTQSNITNPNDASFADGSSNKYSLANGSIKASSGKNWPCFHCGKRQEVPEFPDFPGGGGSLGGFANGMSAEEAIATGNVQITAPQAAERLYVMQMQLFNSLLVDTSLVAQSPILTQFMQQPNNFTSIKQINQAIEIGNTTLAQNLLQNWQSQNLVDDNYKQYYNWLLQNPQTTNNNLNTILQLAQKCPLTNGAVVYAARNLYNRITQTETEFYNNCLEEGVTEYQNRRVTETVIEKKNNNKFNIYPNPSNNGMITIRLDEEINGNYEVIISNSLGKQLNIIKLSPGTKQFIYNTKSNKGVLFVTLVNKKDGNRITKKAIIL